MHGVSIGKEMGVNTWAAFAGSDDQAVVDGDFAMKEDELQPVLKSMLANGINIVAIHQHMTHEDPRFVFLHYWGKGKALDLATSVRQALDAQRKLVLHHVDAVISYRREAWTCTKQLFALHQKHHRRSGNPSRV